MTLVDLIGFVGVAILLAAFFLNVADKLDNNDMIYLSMNFVGAALACIASVLMDYLPFIILEGCWAVVSLLGMFKYRKKLE